jgi:hypothetical protein
VASINTSATSSGFKAAVNAERPTAYDPEETAAAPVSVRRSVSAPIEL